MVLGTHTNPALARFQRIAVPIKLMDNPARRKIGTRHDRQNIIDRDGRILHPRNQRVHGFVQIVRKHVGRHPHRDAFHAIDPHVGVGNRQHHGFRLGTVVVGLVINGILFNIIEKGPARLGGSHFGVTHRRRAIAVHGAEVTLAIN